MEAEYKIYHDKMMDGIRYYADLIEKYCKENGYFTARAFIFFNRISKKDIGKIAHAIRLLHQKGKIQKWGKKTWQWNGNE